MRESVPQKTKARAARPTEQRRRQRAAGTCAHRVRFEGTPGKGLPIPQWRAVLGAAVLLLGMVGRGMCAGNGQTPKLGPSRYADTVFQHLDEHDGLPTPMVMAFAEDGDGFLWVATQGGLARWDGYRFRNYEAVLGAPG